MSLSDYNRITTETYNTHTTVLMAIFYINSNYQNADIVTYCCTQLHFKLPGAFDEQCNAKFVVKYYSCDNVFGVNSITLDFCLDCLYFPHSVIL